MDPEKLKKIVNETPLENSIYLEKKLVDKLIYEDQILGEKDGAYKTVSFRTYCQTTKPTPFSGRGKIAVIFAQGEIYSGESGKNSLSGDMVIGSATVARQLKALRKDSSVKAVILRVDSPGGSPLASNVIAREADLLRKEKPLVVSMSDLAASGGYLISLPSSKILSLPQTITGSIGVLGGKFVLYELYEKIGIKKEVISTSEFADIFSDYRPFNRAERHKMKKLMEMTYRDFKKDVSENRPIEFSDVETAARGRAWVGVTALNLKLVDQIGGMTTAFNMAKKMAGIPPAEPVGIRIYPKKKSLVEFVTELFGMKLKNPFEFNVKEKLSYLKHYFPAVIFPYRIEFD
jgi:protease-4